MPDLRDRLVLTEGAPARPVRLTAAQYRAIRDHQIAVAEPGDQPGEYLVAAGTKVGAATVGELEIVVRPKITIDRLVFLLGYSLHRDLWRTDLVHLDSDTDLLPAVVEVFGRLALEVVERGLLQGYRTVHDTLPVLRGRIRIDQQIGRHHGMAVPLAVEYDDFTTDIAENQILRAATLRGLTVPGIGAEARRRLQKIRRALTEVTAFRRGETMPAWQPSRLNARYVPALRLAEILLAGQSFEHRPGTLPVTGLMFDMWRVFEDFVTAALGDALTGAGGAVSAQHRTHLDLERGIDLRPDLVWFKPRGVVRAVVDAKYKAEKPAGFPNADIYQMLAYCTVFGLRDGHLVYAAGEEPQRSHHVVGTEVRIHCHTLDLALPPPELLAQTQRLGREIAASSIASTVPV